MNVCRTCAEISRILNVVLVLLSTNDWPFCLNTVETGHKYTYKFHETFLFVSLFAIALEMWNFESIWYISQEMEVSVRSYLQTQITDLCNYWFTDLLVSCTSSRNSWLQMSCFSSFRCHSFYHYLNRSVFIKMSARASPVHAFCLSSTYVVNRSFHFKRCRTACPSVYMRICYSCCLCLQLSCVSVLLQLCFCGIATFSCSGERCFSTVRDLTPPCGCGVMSRKQEGWIKISVILASV